MTKDQLLITIENYNRGLIYFDAVETAVDIYSSALIAAKPLVSGSLQNFMDEVEYMMGLYGKQRYTQAEAQRDNLAGKLDDIMRLGGNDR